MPPFATLVNPYPGLAPFMEKDAERFFGRDDEIDDVLKRLATRRLLAVIGVSGCGKSSLVRAGVIPVLRMGIAENLSARFRICTMTPGNAPLSALAAALEAQSDWPATSFDLVDRAKNMLEPGESLLLVVDQFEELFRFRAETIAQDAGNAASLFVNLLLNAVDQREIAVYVLLTMRTDFLGESAQFRGLPEALNDCYYLVPRMTRLQQQEAIERPLQEQGTAIHPALVQRLLNDSAEDPDHLPVLQHALKRLWESWSERAIDEPVGLRDYEAVGSWSGALDGDAERTLAQFPADEGSIRKVFQWITERGIGEKPIRRPRPFSECVEISGLDQERLSDIVRAFQDRGLLRPLNANEGCLVDLPHESVMWQWSRLKHWIAEEAEQGAQFRFLLQSARQRIPLAGLALKSGSEHLPRWRAHPLLVDRYVTAREREEIEAWVGQSERLERTRRHRRAAIMMLIVVALGLLFLLSFYGRYAKHLERRARIHGVMSIADPLVRALVLAELGDSSDGEDTSEYREAGEAAIPLAVLRLPKQQKGEESFLGAVFDHQNRPVTLSSAGAVRLWHNRGRGDPTSVNFQALKLTSSTSEKVSGFSFSADREWIAVYFTNGSGRIERREGGPSAAIPVEPGKPGITAVAFSPDGLRVLAGYADSRVKLWKRDGSGGEVVLNKDEHRDKAGATSQVSGLTFDPSGTRAAAVFRDGQVTVWELQSSNKPIVLRGNYGPITSAVFSHDRNWIICTYQNDAVARIWRSNGIGEPTEIRGHEGVVNFASFSPDGSKVVTASEDKTARIWSIALSTSTPVTDPESGERVKVGESPVVLRGHPTGVRAAAFSDDGSEVATTSNDQVRIWWSELKESRLLGRHAKRVESVAFSRDGKRVVSASADYTARVWSIEGSTEPLLLRGHKDWVRSAAFSPDGMHVVTGSEDDSFCVWDLSRAQPSFCKEQIQTGAPDAERRIKGVLGVAVDPSDERFIIGSRGNRAQVWAFDHSVDPLAILPLPKEEWVWSVAFSPDASRIVTGSGVPGSPGGPPGVRIWTLDNSVKPPAVKGDPVALETPVALKSGAAKRAYFSPAGNSIVTTMEDGTAILWKLDSPKPVLLRIIEYSRPVNDARFSSDGKWLVLACGDRTASILSVADGQERLNFRHQADVQSASFSPDKDNAYIVTGSKDGEVRLWPIIGPDAIAYLKGASTACLEVNDRMRYLKEKGEKARVEYERCERAQGRTPP